MRKRAQRRFKPTFEEPKHKAKTIKPITEKKPLKLKKNTWIILALVAIFLLVLFFNSYYNYSSNMTYNPEGEGLDKYYLSGPDPYYNMRLVEKTQETGIYPYYSEPDPLLNYPLGQIGGRPPLLNMAALGFSKLLTPFMDEIDAIGLSMQFIPALFGALIIFPVYFIGKTMFNKKAGLIAAFFIAIIPIHIGSGHGSAFSLFDHDSLNLLLFFLTYLFLILSLREKDSMKSILYALLGGVSLAALTMTWVESQFLYVIIAVYAIVQILIDMFTNKIDLQVFRTTSILMFSGYLISLPVYVAKMGGINLDTSLALCLLITALGAIYYIFGRKKIPWTISLPIIFSLTASGLLILYFINPLSDMFPFLAHLQRLSAVIFGSGIYGNKVSMTIAEAGTFEISRSVMSFGPALYWMGWGGFIFMLWYYYRDKLRRDYLFLIILFITDLWLASTAGRFLNDMVPLIAILAGWLVYYVVTRIDYKQMFRNIKSAGGGIHGIRRGVKIMHIFGILFIGFIVVLPNVFITFDAATPNKFYIEEAGDWKVTLDQFTEDYQKYQEIYADTQEQFSVISFKQTIFNDKKYEGAYGLSVSKEVYWSDAFNWLSLQDTEIKNPTDRPAFISWWDYGFYEAALGAHPTVADNFQDGIPPAANFHTSIGEDEAVSVWIVRLLEGDLSANGGKISEDVKYVLEKHIGVNDTDDVVRWVENPGESPSFGQPIKPEYDEELANEYTTGQQWQENAMYHDIINLFTNKLNLTDNQITWLYHDMQEATGLSIRYYGVEGYDKQIFNIFAFLSDRSLVLLGAPEDDFVEIIYKGYTVDPTTGEVDDSDAQWYAKDLKEMSQKEIQEAGIVPTGTNQILKDDYFETMFYKTYFGTYQVNDDGTKDVNDYQIPCYNMKHFYAEYISDTSEPMLQYYFNGKAAVVIAKYYEGAYINGSIIFNGESLNKDITVAVSKDLQYKSDVVYPIYHDQMEIKEDDENPNATFNLIGGAGCKISILRNLELSSTQLGPFVVTEVNFSDSNLSDFSPITDEDAMRKPGSNYERNITIDIEPAVSKGFIFNDTDGNGKYNASVDEPLKDATVIFYEINEFDPETLQPSQGETILVDQQTTNETGHYNTTGLVPGWYGINVFYNDFLISQELTPLYSGNFSYNVSMPVKSSVEGTLFYDTNLDGNYNSGDDEEVSDTEIELYYPLTDKIVDTTDSDINGFYSFKDVIPGDYIIKATTDKYETETSVGLNENQTLTFNVSMNLLPVKVSGVAKYNDQLVDGAEIEFSVNESIDLNTAEINTATTDENGEYSIELSPGAYNISISKTVDQVTEETLVYTSPMETLSLDPGQGTVTKNFLNLEKHTATVNGEVTFEGETQNNTTVMFIPINLSADITSAMDVSDSNGIYMVEIMPGEYNISAIGNNLTGNSYNYSWDGTITISEDDIITGVVKDIILVREEE